MKNLKDEAEKLKRESYLQKFGEIKSHLTEDEDIEENLKD